MAQILADRHVQSMLGSAILNTNEDFLNPNGIKLRLGRKVKFNSDKAYKNLGEREYLRVKPGETVMISSHEEFDFTKATIDKIFPGKQVVGLITPTTTMMREGISQLTTKIDSGFKGRLDWCLRNSSFKDLDIQQGEPIYKLTVFLIEEDKEMPEFLYGERPGDNYQNSEGVQQSNRRVDSQIDDPLSSDAYDPSKSLEESGPPHTLYAQKFKSLEESIEDLRKDFSKQCINLKNSLTKTATFAASAIVGVTGLAIFVYDRAGIGVGGIAFVWTVVVLVALIGIPIWTKD